MNEIAAVLHARTRKRVEKSPFPPVTPIILPALSQYLRGQPAGKRIPRVFSFDLALIIESRTYPQRRGTAVSCHHLLRKGLPPLGRFYRVRR